MICLISTPIFLTKLSQSPFLCREARAEVIVNNATETPSLNCFICTVGIKLPSPDRDQESSEIPLEQPPWNTVTLKAPKPQTRKATGNRRRKEKHSLLLGGCLDAMVDWPRKSCRAWNSCSGSCSFSCDPGAVPCAPETPGSEKL